MLPVHALPVNTHEVHDIKIYFAVGVCLLVSEGTLFTSCDLRETEVLQVRPSDREEVN